MNLKMMLSLLLISGMIFINSCGSDEKQPELESLDSVDELIEDLDSAKTDSITKDEVVIAETPKEVDVVVETPSKEVADAAPVTKAGDYSTKPLEGSIVSLDGITMGGNGKVSKSEAQALVGKGNLVLFKATNGTVYFVYNEDGTFAGKRLAGYANNNKVGMLGKTKVVDGLNIFIMTLIEGM
jgi:hypothetical protein